MKCLPAGSLRKVVPHASKTPGWATFHWIGSIGVSLEP